MSAGTHDDWEKLVRSVLRREHERQLALVDSCSVSSTSSVSDPRLSLRSSPPSDYDYSESDPGSPRKILQMNFMDLALDHRQWKEMLPPGKRELLWKSAAPLRYSIHKRSGKTYGHEVEEHFVGMKDDMEHLTSLVTSDERSSRVIISICGMGGLGKTTLATKIYQDNTVQRCFDAKA